MTGRALVWAHRGASGYAPENTLAAFELAHQMHADGIELDIHLSKDGIPVVIHDENTNRTCKVKGLVRDMTYRELHALKCSYKFDQYTNARIPAMEEVFDLVKPTGMTINIELKTGIYFYPGIEDKILELTARCGMEDRVWYSSFNHASVCRIKELNPSAKIGFLCADGYIDMPAYTKAHGADAVHPALYNLQYPDYMKQCKELGLRVHPWTVNERSHMQMCLALGVDALITNYPDRALQEVQGIST